MKQSVYIDDRGRKYLVRQPEGVPDMELHMCPVIGPPEGAVDKLNLPEEIATALHNRLFEVKAYELKDVSRNPQILYGALQSVLNVSVQKLHHAYIDAEPE